jgi:C4-dicarboxylate-specific signal transduction histidine kinase
VVDRVRRLVAGEPALPFVEERLLRKDGTPIHCSVSGVRVLLEGQPCIVAIVRDITEQRRLQARLVEADRMVALGTLSAGIAHEINNPLTYLVLHVDAVATLIGRLRAAVDGDAVGLVDRLAQSVAIAQDGAARVRDIVRDLRVFSRAGDDAAAPIDIRTSLERALSITAHETRERATVVTALGEVPPVVASDGRLTQVFVNLLVNAAHALGPGDPHRHRIEVRSWTEGGAARVSIADSGAGIAPEHLPHIFEPFFTTKPVGEGSGLGLAIAHGIVSAAGGTIEVTSAPDAGSTFVVTLPGCR